MRKDIVLRNALPLSIHEAEIVLSRTITPVGRKLKPFDGFGVD